MKKEDFAYMIMGILVSVYYAILFTSSSTSLLACLIFTILIVIMFVLGNDFIRSAFGKNASLMNIRSFLAYFITCVSGEIILPKILTRQMIMTLGILIVAFYIIAYVVHKDNADRKQVEA